MTQPEPKLPAPLSGTGKTVVQRQNEVEAAVNAMLTYLPALDKRDVFAALKAGLEAEAKRAEAAAEVRQTELLRAVAKIIPPPIELPDLAGLRKDLEDVQSRLAQLADQDVSTALTALREIVDTLAGRVEALSKAPVPEPTDSSLEDQLHRLSERVAALSVPPIPVELEERPDPVLIKVLARVSQLEAALGLSEDAPTSEALALGVSVEEPVLLADTAPVEQPEALTSELPKSTTRRSTKKDVTDA